MPAGMWVSPGFVDVHVHLAAFLLTGTPYQRSDGPSPYVVAALLLLSVVV